MIEEIHLPRWAVCCTKSNAIVLQEMSMNNFLVVDCKDKRDCYGCYPIGTVLPLNPLNLKEVKMVDAMDYPEKDLNGYFLTEKIIEDIIRPFKKGSKKYVYTRGIRCDLDTITVYEVEKS